MKEIQKEDQKCIPEVAKTTREHIATGRPRQGDDMCPLVKASGMMSSMVGFHEAEQKAMHEFQGDHKIMWGIISNTLKDRIKRIMALRFENPCPEGVLWQTNTPMLMQIEEQEHPVSERRATALFIERNALHINLPMKATSPSEIMKPITQETRVGGDGGHGCPLHRQCGAKGHHRC